jgi:hypothetical protein
MSNSVLDQHQKEFIKLVERTAKKHRKYEVFRDFCELAALALSNSSDKLQFETREARYLEIVGKYDKDEVANFPRMLGEIVESLELCIHDALGEIFSVFEFTDAVKGQFFTPYALCKLMASFTLMDAPSMIEKNGFITCSEPAVGAGATILAAAEALQGMGVNYQQCMHVVAQDIDLTAVHMAYIQFSLLHIPAIVFHGNSLSSKPAWAYWVTPAHVMGGWDFRLNRRYKEQTNETTTLKNVSDVGAGQVPQKQITDLRDRIIHHRIEKKEQLNLFD